MEYRDKTYWRGYILQDKLRYTGKGISRFKRLKKMILKFVLKSRTRVLEMWTLDKAMRNEALGSNEWLLLTFIIKESNKI